MEQLARRVGMSPRHFSRTFSDKLGTSPARYVEQCRVEAAAAALPTTDASLGQVAERFGFGRVERMRRAFQRHLGVSPREVRARSR